MLARLTDHHPLYETATVRVAKPPFMLEQPLHLRSITIETLSNACPYVVNGHRSTQSFFCAPNLGDRLKADHFEGIRITAQPANDHRYVGKVLTSDREGRRCIKRQTSLSPRVADHLRELVAQWEQG